MEKDILKLLGTKSKYYQYIRYVKEHTLTKETNLVLQDMDMYYTKHPKVEVIDWTDFSTWFGVVQHPSYSAEVLGVYQNLFETVADTEEGEATSIINHFITVDVATRIFDASAKIAEGTSSDMDSIHDLMEEYNEHTNSISETNEEFTMLDGDNLDVVLESFAAKHGYSWRMPELNQAIGDTTIGDLIALVGRPDSGKTTMLASEATFRAEELWNSRDDGYVLWFNNEEQREKVQLRCWESCLELTKGEILKDPSKYKEEYREKVGDKLKIFDSATCSTKGIEKLVKQYPPRLIIIDQLAKITLNTKEKLNDAAQQLELARFARRLAKNNCTVIFTVWAGGFAEGVKYIEMSHLYGSKTGVQGEADAIITIGRSNDEPTLSDRMKRYIYVCKNKICNGDPTLINGKFEVRLDPQVARFKSA